MTTVSEEPGDAILAPGTLLKHFRIVRFIGRGGMGDVYEAHDESLERVVAIKVIRAGRSISFGDHARLVHEARAQARINHPRVVQIYYVGLEPECPFLAMELVRGTTLAERIRQGPLLFREIVRLSLEVTDALRRAAEMDIVHSDIKPSNILLDEAGTAKLSDFGLAQRGLTAGAGSSAPTGTPKYMAPELTDGQRSSVASDMYALGITLYELTLGIYPYSQTPTTVKEQFEQHRSASVAFPQPWPPDIPEGWKDVLGRLLSKQPHARYADYGRLYADIRRFMPLVRLPAAMLPRGEAWLIDLLLLTAMLALTGIADPLLTAFAGGGGPVADRLTRFSVDVLQAFVFGLIVLAHGRYRTTPGKRLFQISIADQHGLPPSPARMMSRLLLSQFPISLAVVLGFFDHAADGFGWLMMAEALLVVVWFIANTISMLIDTRRLALHDRLLGTRAVVDHPR